MLLASRLRTENIEQTITSNKQTQKFTPIINQFGVQQKTQKKHNTPDQPITRHAAHDNTHH
jgi:hypothetical protein